MDNTIKVYVKTPDGELVTEDIECLPIADTKFETTEEKKDDNVHN